MANSALSLPAVVDRDDDIRFRVLLSQSIRRSGKSREQIADDMARILNRPITARQLNQWSAVSHEAWRMPAIYVSAFCQAVGDNQLQRFLIGPKLSALLKLGEIVEHSLPAVLSNYERSRKRSILRDSESESEQEALFG